jgi:hypothetical protein
MRSVLAVPAIHFTPNELLEAAFSWNCNCGPASLAAATGNSLFRVRPHLDRFETKGHMDFKSMRRAVESLGFLGRRLIEVWPERLGLARIQWLGSWMNPGVHPGAATARTHWVAVLKCENESLIFDVNHYHRWNDEAAWVPREQWERETVPLLVLDVKGATGWKLRDSLEILAAS